MFDNASECPILYAQHWTLKGHLRTPSPCSQSQGSVCVREQATPNGPVQVPMPAMASNSTAELQKGDDTGQGADGTGQQDSHREHSATSASKPGLPAQLQVTVLHEDIIRDHPFWTSRPGLLD